MPFEESIAESAKQRSLRVPLDHYERPDSLVRAKWQASIIAALIGLAYVAWLLLGGRAAQHQASPGPVAGVHAGWNDDCQVCHQDFKPLRSDAIHLFALNSSPASVRESLDQSCIKCHNEPEHHHAAKPDEVPSCAACHREHQGPAASIVRSPDSACLSCHRDINQHRSGPSGLAQAVVNVSGFGPAGAGGEGPHPEYRSLQNDPGNVKFNHWLHMQPGIAADKAKPTKGLSDLDESQRARYATYAMADGLIQLECAACHEPDAGDQYMRPIAFEQHCQACHPLQVRLAEVESPLNVPHGLAAEKLTPVLDGLLFAAERSRADSSRPSPDESGREPLIPGKTLGQNLAQKIGSDLLGRRTIAERTIAAKCQECHYARSDGGNITELLDPMPADIPAKWLRHARFDHNSHRHVECRVCHADAYAFEQRDKARFIMPTADNALARDDNEVMIAGLESCANCHAPARGAKGGARHDCAECHDYHDRDKRASFPASSLGTHNPEFPASTALPMTLDLRPVSFTPLATTSAEFVGTSSCASAGCHGDVRADAPPWRAAFTTWVALGPHVQAYDVLWTYRGREMTRLLAAEDGKEHEPLSDAVHFRALQQRCVGCHATPPQHDGPPTHESYLLGVQCESCHGAAGGWLHTHYRLGFLREQALGMADNKDLAQRAATCTRCHIGPNEDAGVVQVVDHDLIAAGHPRLTFEFNSYLANLPPHWDPKTDAARFAGVYHFRTWLEGQKQHQQQGAKTTDRGGQVDFAQLDCFACHHQLAANSWRQPSKFDDLRPVAEALTLDAVQVDLPLAGRLRLARGLLEESKGRWDAALQSYLATRAILSDIDREGHSHVAADLTATETQLSRLGSYLARDCFPASTNGGRRSTQYDSPTEFTVERVTQRIQPVADALQRLEASVGTP